MNPFFKDDPVFSVLKEKLNANILQVPDGRIVPLGIIEQPLMGPAKFRTTIDQILTNSAEFDLGPEDFDTKSMVGLAGEKTSYLSASAGLRILKGLLSSKPEKEDPNLHTLFQDIRSLAYVFDRLERQWMDNGMLAKRLQNQKISKNALTESFFGMTASKLLIIDSVIVCKEFSIFLDDSTDDDYSLALEALTRKMGSLESDFAVLTQNRSSIRFKGGQGIPIAFTCLHLKLNSEGRIVGMPPRTKEISKIYGSGYEGELMKTMLMPGDGELAVVVF